MRQSGRSTANWPHFADPEWPGKALAVGSAPLIIDPMFTSSHRFLLLPLLSLLTVSSALAQGRSLTRQDADSLRESLWRDHVAKVKAERSSLLKDGQITVDGVTMKFQHKFVGERPKDGWELWISLHGGGGAPKEVNDQQWSNQVNLYSPDGALVIAPRAPTDTWDLWHQAHIDGLFDQLISDLVALGEVNPNKVYLIGYSAGGDGVYQLAPRMADRLAAAGMMAGHPNETVPLGLRNIGFALHMGANDSAYNRNGVAAQWKQLLADLHRADPEGYKHEVVLHEGRGHWMNREEQSALKWMQTFTRDPLPKKVVWKQDDVTHDRFYWLSVPKEEAKQGSLIIARREGQTINIDAAEGVSTVTILLNDEMVDLDKPVVVRVGGREVFKGVVSRSRDVLEKYDRRSGSARDMFSAERSIDIGPEIMNRVEATDVPDYFSKPIDYLKKHWPLSDPGKIDESELMNSVALTTIAHDGPLVAGVPEELFEEFVFPDGNVDEKRETWRESFLKMSADITKDTKTIPEAAMALNRDLFKRVNVQYHPTKRPKPNQSPSESMEAGFASCSGLSILLVDACRSIGIPARIVGTPNWITKKGDANGNHGGNHTWVEIWDGSAWRYLGASEPSEFDQTWFNDNASRADSSVFENGIYAAASRRDSALYFPMVWAPDNQSVPGIDVTDYYAKRTQVTFTLPEASTASIRDNGRLVGVVKGPTQTIPLAGGRLYTAEISDAKGEKRAIQFTLKVEKTQDIGLGDAAE